MPLKHDNESQYVAALLEPNSPRMRKAPETEHLPTTVTAALSYRPLSSCISGTQFYISDYRTMTSLALENLYITPRDRTIYELIIDTAWTRIKADHRRIEGEPNKMESWQPLQAARSELRPWSWQTTTGPRSIMGLEVSIVELTVKACLGCFRLSFLARTPSLANSSVRLHTLPPMNYLAVLSFSRLWGLLPGNLGVGWYGKSRIIRAYQYAYNGSA